MTNQPSSLHGNRKPYNRIAYDLGDAFLVAKARRFRGCLVDLGCGQKPYRDWLLQHADRYVGVDWLGSQHGLHADVVADLNQPLPMKNGVADTVVSFSALEHLREPQLMLDEAFRILRPGGAALLQVPFMWWVHEAPHDYYRFTCHGLRYMLEKAGFTNIEVVAHTGFWVMWTLKLNYQTLRVARGSGPVRRLLRLAVRMLWAIDQPLASWLDRRWSCEEETAAYSAVATKP